MLRKLKKKNFCLPLLFSFFHFNIIFSFYSSTLPFLLFCVRVPLSLSLPLHVIPLPHSRVCWFPSCRFSHHHFLYLYSLFPVPFPASCLLTLSFSFFFFIFQQRDRWWPSSFPVSSYHEGGNNSLMKSDEGLGCALGN